MVRKKNLRFGLQRKTEFSLYDVKSKSSGLNQNLDFSLLSTVERTRRFQCSIAMLRALHYFLAQFEILSLGLKATELTCIFNRETKKHPEGSQPPHSLTHTLADFNSHARPKLSMSVCACTPTFVQVRVAFGLVTEALAASVPSSTDRASWRDVTAGSGHPRRGAGKSDGEREREQKGSKGKKERGCEHRQTLRWSEAERSSSPSPAAGTHSAGTSTASELKHEGSS